MPQAWSAKRERQYQHIKEQVEQRGTDQRRAAEIAARTVNKNRAQAGESEQSSPTSTNDMSPQRRGGLRSGNPSAPRGRTKEQLYQDARKAGIKGRSTMTKKQLQRALDGHSLP
jgi:plasmid stabilization system protein ParE